MGNSLSSCCESGTVGPTLDDRFSGKRVLITGATSGIGLLLAKRLAESGANVVGWGRNETAMEKIKAEASEKDWKLHMMKCDVSRKEEISKSANKVLALLGGVDILVNNAGVMNCPFTLSKDGYELQFATNHLGHYLLTKLLLK